MYRPLLALALLATPAFAQTVGGSSDFLYQWDGSAAWEAFGGVIATAGDINGDGFDDVLVSAPGASPNGQYAAGSVFVYSGLDGSLLLQLDGTTANDRFGLAAACAGDVNADGFVDILVGTPRADPGTPEDSGSAYVFSGVNGALLYQWNGTQIDDHCGQSVSAAGDVNSDGYADVLIGAPGVDANGQLDSGSAFVYSGADGSLLYRFDGSLNDWLGVSVASVSDSNGDGIDDLLAGAPHASPNGQALAGSVSLYSGADGTLLHQFHGAAAYDSFGNVVCGAGDTNADGYGDILVSAVFADPGGLSSAGSVYVFSGLNGLPLLQWNGTQLNEKLGESVAAAGDLNADGFDDLLVGTTSVFTSGIGYANLYSGASGILLHQWIGPGIGDYFGVPVSSAGDLNGDGTPDVLIGASGSSPSGLLFAGSAFAFSFDAFLAVSSPTISASAGGTLNLVLDFPDLAGLDEYKVLISATGVGPTNYGVDIPLSQDSLVMDTYLGNYPVATTNMHGTLDALGDATATLTIPAGIPSALIGRLYYLAAVANQPGQLPEYSSVAASVEITL